MKYEPVPRLSKEQIAAMLEEDDVRELRVAVLSLALWGVDPEWAESVCVALAAHRDPGVRGNAVLGLAHLARLHGRLDRERAESAVVRALADADAFVRGQAEAAAEDLELFLGWRIGRGDS